MRTILLVWALSFVFALNSRAAVDPSLDWKLVRTPHFDLIYAAQQQELAQVYADRLESARLKLQALWPSFPERLTIVLNDRTDLTNGYATPLPYAHVVIFPTLPGPLDGIAEYGDWAEEILIHELTHILSFEQRRGGVKALSYAFGNIITPNALLPRWWLEGVAVDAETRLSSHGRLRSNYQDGSLRALRDDPIWSEIDLPSINEFQIPSFPYGARPYLFGSLLWSEMIALKGERMIYELHDVFGGRFPYFLTGPIQERFDDLDLTEIFNRAKMKTEFAIEAQRKILSTQEFSKTERFQDPDFLETMTPQISPDGLKLVFLAKDDSLKRSLQVLVRPTTEVPFSPDHRIKTFSEKEALGLPEMKLPRNHDDAPPGGTIQRMSWLPDSSGFVFDLNEERDIFHDASDLWIYSFAKPKAVRLSKSLRAREPAVSPDGENIAYIQVEAGRTSLALWNRKEEKSTLLFQPSLLIRASWPVWISNEKILFVQRREGRDEFSIYDLKLQKVSAVLLPLKRDVGLPFVRGSKIYFVANESGIRNLYETDLNFQKIKPLTHLWTGLYASDLDEARQEFWLTTIEGTGFHLQKLSVPSARAQALPVVQPLLADRYPQKNTQPTPPPVVEKEVADYSSLPYLWPRYWLPFFYWDEKGAYLSAATSGFDPLQKHAYTLYGRYETGANLGSYQVSYQNQSFVPTLVFQTADLSSTLADRDQKTRIQTSRIDSLWQISSLSPDFFLIAGGVWNRREQFRTLTTQVGPSLGAAYINVSQSGNQISPESGGSAQLRSTQFLEGEDREHFNLTTFAGVKYGRWPWFKHHAWMARLMGQSIDREVSIANFESTNASGSLAIPSMQNYVMRGYPTGGFLGRSLANASFEYRFPLQRIDHGPRAAPLYFRRLHAALISDSIWLMGYAFDDKKSPGVYRRVTNWKGYSSVGAELKWDVTLGYQFETQLILGAAYPLSNEFTNPSAHLSLGLGM